MRAGRVYTVAGNNEDATAPGNGGPATRAALGSLRQLTLDAAGNETASGTVIGECGLQYLEGGPEIELGYKLARPCWGRGLAAEAAQACLGWALAERPEAVVAIVDPANTRSARILARIGMAREGTRCCSDHLWDFYKAPRP